MRGTDLVAVLAMLLVLAVCAVVLLQVAAPHLRRCPRIVRRWTAVVAAALQRWQEPVGGEDDRGPGGTEWDREHHPV